MEGSEEFVKFSKLANYVEVGKNRNEYSRKYSKLFGKLFPPKQSRVQSLGGTVEASRDGGRSSSTSKRAQSTTNVVDEYSRGIALYGRGIGSTPCLGYSPVLSHSGSAVSLEMVADDDLGHSSNEQQTSLSRKEYLSGNDNVDDGEDIDVDGSFGDGIADYFGFGGELQEKDLEYNEIPPTLLEVKLAKRLVVERFGCHDHDESHAGKGFIDDGDYVPCGENSSSAQNTTRYKIFCCNALYIYFPPN